MRIEGRRGFFFVCSFSFLTYKKQYVSLQLWRQGEPRYRTTLAITIAAAATAHIASPATVLVSLP